MNLSKRVKTMESEKPEEVKVDIEDCKKQDIHMAVIVKIYISLFFFKFYQLKLNFFIIVVQKIHELFSIFLYYEAQISRPVRFILYYMKITLVMAITGLFTSVFILFFQERVGGFNFFLIFIYFLENYSI